MGLIAADGSKSRTCMKNKKNIRFALVHPLLFSVRLAAHGLEFAWTPHKCQIITASPAEPGGTLDWISGS
jgi:hypothetical protein